MAKCIRCNKELTGDDPGIDHKGWRHCAACYAELMKPPEPKPVAQRTPTSPPVVLTTAPTLEGFRVAKTLEIVTAECVLGMNAFRDAMAGLTDIFGGRSGTTQTALRDARRSCLAELRQEATSLGANAVIAVNLAYSEFSGQGKSMLFLVASGTAVVVEPVGERHEVASVPSDGVAAPAV